MDIFIQILHVIRNLLLNPILYWIFLLTILPSDDRINLEKNLFQQKVFPYGAERTNTLKLSLVMTVVLFAFTLGTEMIISYEGLILLNVILVLLTCKNNYIFLSAGYTLGLTYLMFKFFPKGIYSDFLFSESFFSGLTSLVGILLLAEAVMFYTYKDEESFPKIACSKRGRWYGKLQIQRMALFPLFFLIPEDSSTLSNHLWPNFSSGDHTYTLFIMPFAIGFNHVFTGDLPEKVTKKLAASIATLSLIIIALSMISLKIPIFSLFAAILAVLGRTFIHYYYYKKDFKKPPIFIDLQQEVKVLGVASNSPAKKLGFEIGDQIISVNKCEVNSYYEFDQQIKKRQGKGTFQVLSKDNKYKWIENDEYEGDALQLGLLLPTTEIEHSL